MEANYIDNSRTRIWKTFRLLHISIEVVNFNFFWIAYFFENLMKVAYCFFVDFFWWRFLYWFKCVCVWLKSFLYIFLLVWLGFLSKVPKKCVRLCLVLSLSIRRVWPNSSLLMCCGHTSKPQMGCRYVKMICSQSSKWPHCGSGYLLVISGWKQTPIISPGD